MRVKNPCGPRNRDGSVLKRTLGDGVVEELGDDARCVLNPALCMLGGD